MSRLRPTHVLMCTDSLAQGGAERVAVDLANSLDRHAHRVSFCATRSAGPLAELLAPDVETLVLGRRATWDLPALLRFARWVRAHDVDLIHTHGRGTMRFVALARALRLIDVVQVFHDHFGWLHIDRRAPVQLTVPMRSVQAYLGVDSRLCTWAVSEAGLPDERVHLVRSGVDMARFATVTPGPIRELVDAAADTVVVAMVGNFRPQKDHPTMLRAVSLLTPEERARLRIAVIGATAADRDYHAGCMAMVDNLGVGDTVRILDRRDDTPALLAGADAGMVTSKNETGPLVVLEYMASGLPFVAADTGEIAHAVRDLGVGWIVPPRDADALADGLRELLAMSPADRAAMGAEGRRAAVATFDQPHVTARVETIYQGILGLRDEARGDSSPAGGDN